MEPALIFAIMLGVVPALLAMYYLLRGYTAALDEQRIFLAFGIGMILGLVGFTFHVFLDTGLILAGPVGSAIYIFGFAALENLVFFIALNYKWVRGKPEAAFVGISLGAGFSASGVMGYAYNLTARAGLTLEAPDIILLIGLALSSTFFRTAVGAIVGIGSAKSTPWQWYGRALVTQLPYGAMTLGILLSVQYSPWLWALLLAVLVAYSLWLLLYVWRNLIPEFLPGDLKRKIRRERRRPARSPKT
jgi:predicted permease